jgi:hypothetical protein
LIAASTWTTTAQAHEPAFSSSLVILAPAATSTAEFLIPFVAAGANNATVDAETMLAFAQMHAPKAGQLLFVDIGLAIPLSSMKRANPIQPVDYFAVAKSPRRNVQHIN